MVRYRHHYLHNNFVVTLLNDLFGIQARGGRSCAGPYTHRLLGIGPDLSREYTCVVDDGFLSLARVGASTSTTSSPTRVPPSSPL
jgi:selenocysteine lyase/cysteine desulfurase